MICKILGQFVNPFTADDKYSVFNRGNLLQHFQRQLSEKGKIFSGYFFTFYKFRFNFEHLKKNMTLIDVVFLNLRALKQVVRQMSKKSHFRGPFNK